MLQRCWYMGMEALFCTFARFLKLLVDILIQWNIWANNRRKTGILHKGDYRCVKFSLYCILSLQISDLPQYNMQTSSGDVIVHSYVASTAANRRIFYTNIRHNNNIQYLSQHHHQYTQTWLEDMLVTDRTFNLDQS